jgi:hypothetical protein
LTGGEVATGDGEAVSCGEDICNGDTVSCDCTVVSCGDESVPGDCSSAFLFFFTDESNSKITNTIVITFIRFGSIE